MTDMPLDPPPASEPEDTTSPVGRSTWPTVIGIISVIYASLGLLCGIGGNLANAFLAEFFMNLGGMDVTMPPAMKIAAIANVVVYLPVGILLLVAGIKLLRRSPAGVRLHKIWAGVRVVLVLVSFVAGFLMLPIGIDYQRSVKEAMNERIRETGGEQQPFDEDMATQMGMYSLVGMSALTLVYPVFIGVYLSRRRVREEVDRWSQDEGGLI